MNTMSAIYHAKDENIVALKQTITSIVSAMADCQNPCNNITPPNIMVNPEANPEGLKNGGKYSLFLISTELRAIDGATENVSTKADSVAAKRHTIKTRQQPPTTWEKTRSPGRPTAEKI